MTFKIPPKFDETPPPDPPDGAGIKSAKALLRHRLVEHQLKISELSRRLREREEDLRNRDARWLQDIFEVLDTIDRTEDALGSEEAIPHGGAPPRWVKLVRAVQRKLLRLLEARQTVAIEFPNNKARIEYCKVIETKAVAGLADETILSVLKKGYMDRRRGQVLRKAEVITVRNDSSLDNAEADRNEGAAG